MERRISTFGLTPISLPRVQLSENSYKSAAEFFDFVIDGSALLPTLKTHDIGVLSHDWNGAELARQLLLEAPSDPRLKGGTLIYGCRECLDVACGGIAVKIARVNGHITWSPLERYWFDAGHDEVLFKSTKIGPFEFDFAQYKTALEGF
jgi:hypothetical protein